MDEVERGFLERLDAHIAQGNEHMARGNEVMTRSNEVMARNHEVMARCGEALDLNRQTFADARVALRDWMRRDEAIFQQLSAQNAKTLAGLEEVRDDIRAQTQAVLAMLDRLPPPTAA